LNGSTRKSSDTNPEILNKEEIDELEKEVSD